MRRPLRTAALAAMLCLSTANAALAQAPAPDAVERARTFFNAGAQAYAAARYADAARSFDEAYRQAPRPQILFSLAQAERKEFFASNDASYLKRAIDHYKAYLDQVPSGGRRSEATEAKADLEARLSRLDPQQVAATPTAAPRKARVTVYSPTVGAHVSIDGRAPEELPYFGDLEPGKHRIRVSADGYFDEEREVSGDRPVDVPVDLALRERPAQLSVAYDGYAEVYVDGRIVATTPVSRPIEVVPGPHVISVAANGRKTFSQEVVLPRAKPFRIDPKLDTSGQRIVAFTMLGGGAFALITGGIFGLGALNQEARAKDILASRAEGNIAPEELASYNRAVDKRDVQTTVSLISTAVGAALVGGGAVLYFFDHSPISVVPPRSVEPAPSAPRPLDVAAHPIVGPGLYGAGMTVRF